jgi:hypothetical protein
MKIQRVHHRSFHAPSQSIVVTLPFGPKSVESALETDENDRKERDFSVRRWIITTYHALRSPKPRLLVHKEERS